MAQPIKLNEEEAQLRGLLLDVAKRLDDGQGSGPKPKEPTVLRWAGGWVRDKLLGIESNDLDTAINNMTGEAFALQMCNICELPEVREHHSLRPSDIGNLHMIPKNPEKSKHLETTTMKLFGLELDFVNLRKETYAADSRNPQVEFGTAEEDALRRDATVNALFYNLHTGEVEDFVGGLADMEKKLIRTPLEPLQTFTDDPLRVLRLIRFASRLQFSIEPETQNAMAEPSVLEALNLKISRERVGTEVEKMLKGPYPRDSLKLIDTIGLYHTIFTDPNRRDMPRPDISNWRAAYECLQHLAQERGVQGSLYDLLVEYEDANYLSWILAALTPWEQLPDEEPPRAGKPPLPLATSASREGIKATNKMSDVITAAHRHRPAMLELKRLVDNKDERMSERDRFGVAIQNWEARGGHWRSQVLYSILVDVMERAVDISTKPDNQTSMDTERDKVLQEWGRFLDHLKTLDVMFAPGIARIIDGRQLAGALGVKPGRWMAPALDIVMAWQLRNPGKTDPAAAVEEVRTRSEELGIR